MKTTYFNISESAGNCILLRRLIAIRAPILQEHPRARGTSEPPPLPRDHSKNSIRLILLPAFIFYRLHPCARCELSTTWYLSYCTYFLFMFNTAYTASHFYTITMVLFTSKHNFVFQRIKVIVKSQRKMI